MSTLVTRLSLPRPPPSFFQSFHVYNAIDIVSGGVVAPFFTHLRTTHERRNVRALHNSISTQPRSGFCIVSPGLRVDTFYKSSVSNSISPRSIVQIRILSDPILFPWILEKRRRILSNDAVCCTMLLSSYLWRRLLAIIVKKERADLLTIGYTSFDLTVEFNFNPTIAKWRSW